MKKLFFFLALLLPIGAWADETVIAEKNWISPYFFIDEGVGATCNTTSEGLSITNPAVQTEVYKPQTGVLQAINLEKDNDYIVRITAKIPSDGKIQVNMGNWESCEQYEKVVVASDDDQVIDIDFTDYAFTIEDAHILFQSGWIKGTTIIKNVEVIDKTNEEKVIAERNYTSPYWFADEGTGATYEMTSDGVAITNPAVQAEMYTPQTSVLDATGVTLKRNHSYKVIITAMIPSSGQLQVNMGGGEYYEQYSVDVAASSDFQDIEVLFQYFNENLEDVHVLFQNGKIKGTSIVQNVRIVDLDVTAIGENAFWTLAGDESLVGKDWDVSSTINNMITLDGEVYTITKKNLTLSKGTYHFKVYKNNLMDESYPSSDATLVIDEEGVYTVKFTFNANAKELSAIAKKQTAGEFETAAEAVKNMKIGWNLVNTLDSYGVEDLGLTKPQDWETCWGNPVTKPELIKMIRKAGFNTMRIPVTWFLHTDAQGNIDPAWMKRVHEVVDYVIDQGMYCILNTHHDTASDVDEETGVITRPAKLIADPDNYRENKEWFEKLWRQIAEEFKDYDEHLLFEGYNEMADKYGAWFGPNGDYGAEHVQQVYDAINDYAQSFVNAVRSTGGKNLERNLVVSTYTAALGPGIDWGTEACRQMKVPQDVTFDHIAFEVHCYWFNGRKEADEVISNIKHLISSRGIPTIVGEYAIDLRDVDFYFTSKAKENNIAPIIWSHIVSDGNFRMFPAFDASNKVEAALKAYYGDWYEPQLLTLDDYESQGVKVSYDYQWSEFQLCGELDPNEYKGIRVEVEKADGLAIKAYGDSDERIQYCDVSESLVFDKSIIGDNISGITLQNVKEGKNETKIINVWLMKADGTEEMLKPDAYNVYRVYHGCEYEVISTRKQFVHTVEFDGLWAELNLFSDDIPLKLKNYKGIRLELAEMPKYDTCHLKVYGDGEKNTDDIGLTGTSTTIIFNPEIFSSEINRVTLISDIEDKFTAKVLCAYLVRQDGTEEYSDLSIFHNCKIEGDVNDDGKVDSTDVKAIVELIMKGEYKAKADVNGDSKVNAADIVLLTNEIK